MSPLPSPLIHSACPALPCPPSFSLPKDTSKLHLNTTPPSLSCDHYYTTLLQNDLKPALKLGSSQPQLKPSSLVLVLIVP